MNYVLITNYGDNSLIDISLKSLRKVSDCQVVIFSDKPIDYGYNSKTIAVSQDVLNIGIMGSKMITHYQFVQQRKTGDKIISADNDLFYLSDPFTAFENSFDIGLTTRHYKWHYPINGGVVMFKAGYNLKSFLTFVLSQLKEVTWKPLKEFQNKFSHSGNNWYIDQDIWCTAWNERQILKERLNLNIEDIGYRYNFCPHSDGDRTEIGKHELMDAYTNKSVAVLHLKSRLKELVLDGNIG